MSNYQKDFTVKALNTFLEKTFEIAFGDDAINKSYTMAQVVNKLKEFSDEALNADELFSLAFGYYNSIEDFEKAKKEYLEGDDND